MANNYLYFYNSSTEVFFQDAHAVNLGNLGKPGIFDFLFILYLK